MERIGILGGTFDPPHLGHFMIANEVFHELMLDKIIFLPAWIPPHKENIKIMDPDVRLQLLKLVIKDIPYFQVDETEIESQGKLKFTYDTIKVLKKKYQECELFFIIGADQVEKLDTWYNIDKLMNEVNFIGVNRKNYSNKTNYEIKLLELPILDISSSLIKDRLNSGRDVRFLLPEPIYKYIKENRIYE
jgi:nicotinate-nucleotide adenylyltransferase